ncbi:MAG TPA: hypothetical protein VLX68_14760 [Chitinivibrionales bacterium]|nr:hypothetical protein [Chitinivibrionales bacterium]
MKKQRVAVFDFACCEGCQLQLLNMDEKLLDLLAVVDIVEWREGMSEHGAAYDIALIEGSITRPEDEERIRRIREQAPVLIELGACASIGGVNKIKNASDLDEVKSCVYGSSAGLPQFATYQTKAIHEVVQVEYTIHGCPIDLVEFTKVMTSIVIGTKPDIPSYPVCVECKMRGNPCRYDYNELCLGVITRAGCNAPCPSAGFWCFGCRGLVDDPNVNAARGMMKEYNITLESLVDKIALFNTR